MESLNESRQELFVKTIESLPPYAIHLSNRHLEQMTLFCKKTKTIISEDQS